MNHAKQLPSTTVASSESVHIFRRSAIVSSGPRQGNFACGEAASEGLRVSRGGLVLAGVGEHLRVVVVLRAQSADVLPGLFDDGVAQRNFGQTLVLGDGTWQIEFLFGPLGAVEELPFGFPHRPQVRLPLSLKLSDALPGLAANTRLRVVVQDPRVGQFAEKDVALVQYVIA